MSTVGEFMREEIEALRQVRDEMRVQSELASMELRDQWHSLEQRFEKLEGKLRSLGETAKEEVADVEAAAKLLVDELREGYDHLRSRL